MKPQWPANGGPRLGPRKRLRRVSVCWKSFWHWQFWPVPWPCWANCSAQACATDKQRDLTRAQMLCEEIEEEVVAGVIAPSAVSNVPCDDDQRWLYSILCDTDQSGLLILQITVQKDLPAEQHPVQFTLWRWMIDPNVAVESNSLAQAQSGTTSTTSSSSSSPSTNSGGAQ